MRIDAYVKSLRDPMLIWYKAGIDTFVCSSERIRIPQLKPIVAGEARTIKKLDGERIGDIIRDVLSARRDPSSHVGLIRGGMAIDYSYIIDCIGSNGTHVVQIICCSPQPYTYYNA